MSADPLKGVVLSEEQCTLIDELAEIVSVAVGHTCENAGTVNEDDSKIHSTCVAVGGNDYEAFYRHWRRTRAAHRRLPGPGGADSRWGLIDKMQELCESTCGELDGLMGHLFQLDEKRKEVIRKTTDLHEQCEQMVKDQARLAKDSESLAERLDYYDRVSDVARALDQGGAAAPGTNFATVLDQLDGSISFLESHQGFSQAQQYLHQFEHLRSRACISVRSMLQRSLEKSTAMVEQQLRAAPDGELPDTQVFYTRFRAAAVNHKPSMALLAKRVDAHEAYSSTLEELEAFYVHMRIRLVSAPVTTYLNDTLDSNLGPGTLAPAVRRASSYMMDICAFERQCFEAYFVIRQPQEALRTLLDTISNIFYKALRPIIIGSDSIDCLREIADCLHMDVLEPHKPESKTDMVPALATVYRLLKDVQERLIFIVESYIRDNIKGYQVTVADLDYPNLLFTSAPNEKAQRGEEDADIIAARSSSAGLGDGWFPPLRKTLAILERIYRVLEMSTFQGLAQEAVDLCVVTLKTASDVLSTRQVGTRQSQPQALLALTKTVDSQLFMVRHLLALRERIAAFECDLVVSQTYFEFSNVWEALQFKLPDGLLGILKPKLALSEIDSKKDIESELKAACENLITGVVAHITQPLAPLNTQIGDFLARPGADRTQLSSQPFMAAEKIRDAVMNFLANVRERVPFVVAHIRLYLAAGGGTSSSSAGQAGDLGQGTANILFKPVESRLVDTWGRLEGLLEECGMTSTEFEGLGFIRQGALRALTVSLFEVTMSVAWDQLVGIVSQVPRGGNVAGQTSDFIPPEAPKLTTSVDTDVQAESPQIPSSKSQPSAVTSSCSPVDSIAVTSTTENPEASEPVLPTLQAQANLPSNEGVVPEDLQAADPAQSDGKATESEVLDPQVSAEVTVQS